MPTLTGRLNVGERRRLPVRMRQQPGDDVADVEPRRRAGRSSRRCAVGAAHDERPDDDRRQRHDDVTSRQPNSSRLLATPANSATTLPKLVTTSASISQERHAEAELLADQVAQPLAGDGAHARRHLLDDDQRDRDRDHRPQQRVAELRAGQRIGEDAAGVVVDVGGDEPGTDDREEQRRCGRASS